MHCGETVEVWTLASRMCSLGMGRAVSHARAARRFRASRRGAARRRPPIKSLCVFKPTGFDLGVFEAREASGEVLEPPLVRAPGLEDDPPRSRNAVRPLLPPFRANGVYLYSPPRAPKCTEVHRNTMNAQRARMRQNALRFFAPGHLENGGLFG